MTSVGQESKEASILNVIRVDQQQVRGHVDEVVRSTVQQTLNSLLDVEADELCGARRYQRSAECLDTRAGHYRRKLTTKAGEVESCPPDRRSQSSLSTPAQFRRGIGRIRCPAFPETP